MSWRPYLLLIPASALQSCLVYDSDLLDEAGGSAVVPGEGGTASGGLDGSGAAAATGSASSTGGSSGEGDGGGSATGGLGGDTSGATGGSDGTGGNQPGGTQYTLVDDMDHAGNDKYSNFPFSGEYGRYGQESSSSCNAANWTADEVAEMFVVDPDDAKNTVLRIKATALDCWGVGVFLALNAPSGTYQATDLSGYDGIRLRARRLVNESVVNVRLADASSHPDACGATCAEDAIRPINLKSDWSVFEFPLSQFSRTGPALDLETVYAMHFAIDPSGTEVDFLVDDIEFYTEE